MGILYSIIPPILIVLSLVGLVVMIMRKATDVASVSEKEEQMNLLKKGVEAKSLSGNRDNFSRRILSILEGITRKFRGLFIKLEGMLASWGKKLREKRRDRSEVVSQSDANGSSKEDILEKVRNYGDNKEFVRRSDSLARRHSVAEEQSKTVLENFSGDKTVKKVEIKERLEKILIERIAVNPKDTEAYERLGEYYFEIGNWEHSKECFKQVLKLNPGNFSVKQRMRKLERLLSK